MLSTLRGRLIASYMGVVLPALLLATAVYLVLGIRYKTEDAYRQLTTSLYLVMPQIQDAVGPRLDSPARTTVLDAAGRIRDALNGIEAEVAPGSPTVASARVLSATREVRADLDAIDAHLAGLTQREQTRITSATGRIRDQLARIDSAVAPGHRAADAAHILTATGFIRGELAPILDVFDPRRILNVTSGIQGYALQIRNELQNTRFRLLIVERGGVVDVDSLRTQAQASRVLLQLPPALLAQTPITAPVQGRLAADDRGAPWIYAAAPPGVLVGTTPPAVTPAVFVLLAERQPDFRDVVQDFFQRFLLFGLIALAVALALGWVLARSITRPIAALAAATHQIARGNYAHQAPVTGSVEMRDLAADFNHMVARVEGAQEAQQEFLANVSHDLKTPLTSIQGFSQAMLDGTLHERAAFVAAAAVINAESQRMARLVADLVDLVRLQSGETPIAKQPVDLPSLLQRAVSGMQPQATERHVELRVESGPLPPLDADPDRLRRAITNLLDNAVRHTPPEGRVTLRAEGLPGAVAIHVRDTGAGIPAGDLPRVFDRFYQVDKARAANGEHSGLGLAIVREIATAHGGQVTVQSQPGAGSEFVITLPIGA